MTQTQHITYLETENANLKKQLEQSKRKFWAVAVELANLAQQNLVPQR